MRAIVASGYETTPGAPDQFGAPSILTRSQREHDRRFYATTHRSLLVWHGRPLLYGAGSQTTGRWRTRRWQPHGRPWRRSKPTSMRIREQRAFTTVSRLIFRFERAN